MFIETTIEDIIADAKSSSDERYRSVEGATYVPNSFWDHMQEYFEDIYSDETCVEQDGEALEDNFYHNSTFGPIGDFREDYEYDDAERAEIQEEIVEAKENLKELKADKAEYVNKMYIARELEDKIEDLEYSLKNGKETYSGLIIRLEHDSFFLDESEDFAVIDNYY